jgi:hypothetical protein
MDKCITALLAGALLSAAALAPGPSASTPMGAEVQGAEYDAARGVTTVHVVNTSHKEISAIDLAFQVTFADGTESAPGSSFRGQDFVAGITQGRGGFAPGAELDVEFTGQEGPVRAKVDVVIYADGTADVLNGWVFKSLVVNRKGTVRGMRKVDELLNAALSDPSLQHPSATVMAQLKSLYAVIKAGGSLDEDRAGFAMELQVAIQDISHTWQSPDGRSEREDSRLRDYIVRNEEQVALLLPHTEVVARR